MSHKDTKQKLHNIDNAKRLSKNIINKRRAKIFPTI